MPPTHRRCFKDLLFTLVRLHRKHARTFASRSLLLPLVRESKRTLKTLQKKAKNNTREKKHTAPMGGTNSKAPSSLSDGVRNLSFDEKTAENDSSDASCDDEARRHRSNDSSPDDSNNSTTPKSLRKPTTNTTRGSGGSNAKSGTHANNTGSSSNRLAGSDRRRTDDGGSNDENKKNNLKMSKRRRYRLGDEDEYDERQKQRRIRRRWIRKFREHVLLQFSVASVVSLPTV